MNGAGLEVIEQEEIRQEAGSNQSPVTKPEAARSRPACRPVDRGNGGTQSNRPPDQKIEVSFFVDVQGIAVVRAEAQKGRRELADQWSECGKILRNRSLADEHLHALGELLPSFGEVRCLVAVANAAREIGIQGAAREQRRMTINMLTVKRQPASPCIRDPCSGRPARS